MKLMPLSLILGALGLLAGTSEFLADDGDALQQSYYANGNTKESAAYVEFRRHGPCRRWYEDGTLRAEGEYDHGKLVGEWTWWSPDGDLDEERSGFYVAGRLQR